MASPTAATDRELDLVLWGATGFTGRLVAEHLLARHGAGGEDGALRWTLGGRSREKLEAVQRELGPGAADLPLVLGDAGDAASMAALAARTRVVCTTVGPYARYGSELVAACARAGTHYCDLTGELPWMRRMIDAHEKDARASGARIVHTCGFDSIPSDLGVLFVQREMQARHGTPCAEVRCGVQDFRGGMSGGTIASIFNLMAEARSDPAVRRLLSDPYALNPPDLERGPDVRDTLRPGWDDGFGSWTAPFVMASLNSRVVRRSHALLGRPSGRDFRYDEFMLTGTGPRGLARAVGVSAGLGAALAAGAVGPLRDLAARFLPAPGEGPSRAQREAGFFDMRFLGTGPDEAGPRLRARVTGDRDPGYGSTARMLGEAAACLAQDDLAVSGGFWTPASALGASLLARLQAHAGLDFSVDPEAPASAAGRA